MNYREITLVLPSLSYGGMERVMSQLANYFVSLNIQVTLILLTKKGMFYELEPEVKVIQPDFTIDQMPRLLFQARDIFYLRNEIYQSNSKSLLTFGGKYNAFVLLAAMGLNRKIFISDRSRPTISYGRFLDTLNPWMYRLAAGIVVQTGKARKVLQDRTNHNNIKVIPNPVRHIGGSVEDKDSVILNVGRFISSKHQDWLLDYYEELNTHNWRLIFLGDGPKFKTTQQKALGLSKSKGIDFKGTVKQVDDYYRKSAIFAFTSTSEGFPNVLGEAMAAGCACISFDCEVGPADLIDDGVNGFLIPEGDHQEYKEKLQLLINESSLRQRLGKKAQEKIKEFTIEKVGQQYLEFLFN